METLRVLKLGIHRLSIRKTDYRDDKQASQDLNLDKEVIIKLSKIELLQIFYGDGVVEQKIEMIIGTELCPCNSSISSLSNRNSTKRLEIGFH